MGQLRCVTQDKDLSCDVASTFTFHIIFSSCCTKNCVNNFFAQSRSCGPGLSYLLLNRLARKYYKLSLFSKGTDQLGSRHSWFHFHVRDTAYNSNTNEITTVVSVTAFFLLSPNNSNPVYAYELVQMFRDL